MGFRHEGVLRHAFLREGPFVHAHRMSILSGEWRAQHGLIEGATPDADPAG